MPLMEPIQFEKVLGARQVAPLSLGQALMSPWDSDVPTLFLAGQ